jgi:plastocyanin
MAGGEDDEMTDVKRRLLLGKFSAILAVALAVPLIAAEKPRAKNHDVDIAAKGFQPARITVKAGDSVTWTNGDARDHTVTASNGAFGSGNIKSGGRFSFRFTKPGTYPYSCSLHPRMKGTIVVQ